MAYSQNDAFRPSDKKGGQTEINVAYIENLEEDTDTSYRLRRDLKSRHIIMITIGGAIGTNLINGTYASVPKSLTASIANFEFIFQRSCSSCYRSCAFTYWLHYCGIPMLLGYDGTRRGM